MAGEDEGEGRRGEGGEDRGGGEEGEEEREGGWRGNTAGGARDKKQSRPGKGSERASSGGQERREGNGGQRERQAGLHYDRGARLASLIKREMGLVWVRVWGLGWLPGGGLLAAPA